MAATSLRGSYYCISSIGFNLAKPCADGSQAAGLLNRSESTIKITFDSKAIVTRASVKFRDILNHMDLGAAQNSYASEILTHNVELMKISN